MGRLIGYARVSTAEQDLSSQIDALKEAGCELVFKDKVSGVKAKRPGLDACLAALAEGDTLVFWRLDRLGRSVRHLIEIVNQLKEQGVAIKSLSDGAIDTTTSGGQLLFYMFAALAEFERGLIVERTRAGLEAARARGRKGGRPPVSPDDPRVKMAQAMHQGGSLSVDDICKSLKISRATLYRYLKL